jgi:tRNA 2-selenouridine synthase SelU
VDRGAPGRSVAALGTEGITGAVNTGIITFFKRRGQSAIDALDAALPCKPIKPEITAALPKLDKIDWVTAHS